jgi:hypothetical protein
MLDFPGPPLTVGQVWNNWTWDGTKWTASTPAPPLVSIGTVAPTSPNVGNFWWDSTGGNLYVYYNDGSSSQWVPSTNVAGPPGAQGVPGPTAVSANANNLAVLGTDSLLYVPVAPNSIAGCNTSNVTNTTFGVNPGGATSDDNSTMLVNTGLTKATNAAWAFGNGNGALDTGALAANTWYHAFLIKRMDTGLVDVLMSLSATAPTLPTNYTKKRRVGSFCTDGSGFLLPWVQSGDYFERRDGGAWDVSNGSVTGSAYVNFAVHAPPGIRTRVDAITMFWGTTAGVGWVQITATDNTALGGGYPAIANLNANAIYSTGYVTMLLNTDATIRTYASASSAGFYFRVMGWTDMRGK